MGQQDYSHFSCSNGWFDDNFSWHTSYDNVYGKPLGMPKKLNDNEYFRQFEKCNLTVNIKERYADFVWVGWTYRI